MRRRRSRRQASLAEALLAPTRIYVQAACSKAMRETGAVKALAHITGGGLVRKPAARAARRRWPRTSISARWQAPAVFGWLQQAGNLDDAEMLRTFNCGIGMVLVVGARRGRRGAGRALRPRAKAPIVIGEIEPGRGVKSPAKGKGEAEAVRYSGKLRLAE